MHSQFSSGISLFHSHHPQYPAHDFSAFCFSKPCHHHVVTFAFLNRVPISPRYAPPFIQRNYLMMKETRAQGSEIHPRSPFPQIFSKILLIPKSHLFIIQNVASLCIGVVYFIVYGGDCANPFIREFGPSILGIGFLVALTVLILGTP